MTTLISDISVKFADSAKNESGAWRIAVPITPVPASRPRFTRRGHVHYGKNYSRFRAEASTLIGAWDCPPEFPLEGPLVLDVKFYIKPPKKPKNGFPRGDVDNYFKTLDVFNGVVWGDDVQIVKETTTKMYCSEIQGIEMEVREIEQLPVPRALPEVWITG